VNNVLLRRREGSASSTSTPSRRVVATRDLVRTAVSPAAEDEPDLSKVVISVPMFEALAAGYIEAAGSVLSAAERMWLVLSGKLLTYEVGLRFLTDHLEGDVYFRIHRPGHNLDRARAQFALLRALEEMEETLSRIVERLSPDGEAARATPGSPRRPG
jgi:hypothetical protein